MQDFSDMALVREYVRVNSEAAFAELVERHIALVYSAAFRHAGIAAHAEEITQAVFIILARKAAGLRPDTILAGWLCETTRLTALSFMRGEHRRQRREQEAYMQSTLRESTDETVWNQLSPLLDEALARLGRKERDAVVLRYFKDQNLREVAGMLNINEPAAQKRVNRALEKLRKFFLKRGVTSTTATIAGAISANSVQAAPVGLAKTISVIAIAKGAAAGTATLTLVKGALKIMAWTKIQTAIAVATGLLLAAGATTAIIQETSESSPDYPSWTNDPKNWVLDFKNSSVTSGRISQLPPICVIRPTHFPNDYGVMTFGDKIIGKNQPISELFRLAYDPLLSHRFIIPDNLQGLLGRKKYDIMLTLPATSRPREELQNELRRRFNIFAHFETNEVDVFIMKQINTKAVGLVPTAGKESSVSSTLFGNKLEISNWPMSSYASQFENLLKIPISDQTKIEGNYDCTLTWKKRSGESFNDAFKRAVSEELGLELVPSRERIEMLLVEKVK